MQKMNSTMKAGQRESNKEQKRKSALISMTVPGPATTTTTHPRSPNATAMKLISANQSLMTTPRRASPVKKEEKPKLVRVVSVEEEAGINSNEIFQLQEDPSGIAKEDPTMTPESGAANNIEGMTPEEEEEEEEESGSFHEDLDRLGHAIRSLSFRVLTSTPNENKMRSSVGEDADWQHASTTSQNPFDLPSENHDGLPVPKITPTNHQNPFDFVVPSKNAQAADEQWKNAVRQNPFEETHVIYNSNHSPVFMEGFPLQDFSQSNPFDDAGNSPFPDHSMFPIKSAAANVPTTPETAASSLNPFDLATPEFSFPADASPLQVPLHGENLLLVPPHEVNASLDVPVHGQRMLMTSVSDVDDDFDVPLDGARVMMSPYSSHDTGNETTDDEGDCNSDDDDDDDDEIDTMKLAKDILGTEHPVATDRFSFC